MSNVINVLSTRTGGNPNVINVLSTGQAAILNSNAVIEHESIKVLEQTFPNANFHPSLTVNHKRQFTIKSVVSKRIYPRFSISKAVSDYLPTC